MSIAGEAVRRSCTERMSYVPVLINCVTALLLFDAHIKRRNGIPIL